MSDREVEAVPAWLKLGARCFVSESAKFYSDWAGTELEVVGIGYHRNTDPEQGLINVTVRETEAARRDGWTDGWAPNELTPLGTLPAEPARVSGGIEETIATEIVEIMQEYDRQEAANGYVDTPGGLEHMGDVWRLLGGWRRQIEADRHALAASRPPETARAEG